MKPEKVLIALSGGLASSVAAALLKSQGFEVRGVHFVFPDRDQLKERHFETRCAQKVNHQWIEQFSKKLGIYCEIIDIQSLFYEAVFDQYIHDSIALNLPNPCISCHFQLKIGLLLKRADEIHIEKIATGHCAKIISNIGTGSMSLQKGIDRHRDQSYFLFQLSQDILKRLLMPLGDIPGSMLKKLTLELGIDDLSSNSREICFNQNDRQDLIASRVAPSLRPKGVIRTVDGHLLGEHDGLFQYQIGNSETTSLGEQFVVGFELGRHALIMGGEKHLFHKNILVTQVSWVGRINRLLPFHCKAKMHPAQAEVACHVTSFENQTVQVEFNESQRALSPGQVIVFYQDDELLGGGYIHRVW